MKLERINDGGIINAFVESGLLDGVIAYTYIPEGKAVADAQLEADQEAHDAVIREIFEEIEKKPIFVQSNSLGIKVPVQVDGWWQTLKQKYLGG